MNSVAADLRTRDLGALDIRAGGLELRLATSAADIEAAQALRYRVFYEEMGADPAHAPGRRDRDSFDAVCDHLLAIDRDRPGAPVVGTYRLLRRSVAERHGRFYSAGEFDIADLLALDGELLELGRSCVDPAYRTRSTIQLLLRGIGAYVERYEIVQMFGCASLPGTDPDAVAAQLSYLRHNHLAPRGLCPRALAERYVEMNRIPAGRLDRRAALAGMPPLIKGYLRAGCFVGDGAVIDRQFHTIDVCIVLGLDGVTRRFRQRYEGGAGGRSAG